LKRRGPGSGSAISSPWRSRRRRSGWWRWRRAPTPAPRETEPRAACGSPGRNGAAPGADRREAPGEAQRSPGVWVNLIPSRLTRYLFRGKRRLGISPVRAGGGPSPSGRWVRACCSPAPGVTAGSFSAGRLRREPASPVVASSSTSVGWGLYGRGRSPRPPPAGGTWPGATAPGSPGATFYARGGLTAR